jgi:hypothetical protein
MVVTPDFTVASNVRASGYFTAAGVCAAAVIPTTRTLAAHSPGPNLLIMPLPG